MDNYNDIVPDLSKDDFSVLEARRCLKYDLDWRIILNLFRLPSAKPSISWVADTTGIPQEKVSKIIDGLLSIDLLKRTASGFQFQKDYLSDYEKSAPDDLKTRLKTAQQVLNKFEPGITLGRLMHFVLPSDRIKAKEMADRIKLILNEYDVAPSSESTDGDSVWGLSMVMVRLTNEVSK